MLISRTVSRAHRGRTRGIELARSRDATRALPTSPRRLLRKRAGRSILAAARREEDLIHAGAPRCIVCKTTGAIRSCVGRGLAGIATLRAFRIVHLYRPSPLFFFLLFFVSRLPLPLGARFVFPLPSLRVRTRRVIGRSTSATSALARGVPLGWSRVMFFFFRCSTRSLYTAAGATRSPRPLASAAHRLIVSAGRSYTRASLSPGDSRASHDARCRVVIEFRATRSNRQEARRGLDI